jgi:hypothetical protein
MTAQAFQTILKILAAKTSKMAAYYPACVL